RSVSGSGRRDARPGRAPDGRERAPGTARMVERPTIGVLALQGDVEKHMQAAERAGAEAVAVRSPEQLAAVDALILPGGESTTQGMLLERYELMEPLRRRLVAGMPALGTCTGLILLARELVGSAQPRIGGLD